MEARAEWGASRTRYRFVRLVRLSKAPAGMLVSKLPFCSGMGRRGAKAAVDFACVEWGCVGVGRGDEWHLVEERGGVHHARELASLGPCSPLAPRQGWR